MKTIDLRSDTVTLPTPAMREAIYRAEKARSAGRLAPATGRGTPADRRGLTHAFSEGVRRRCIR
jgi:hypothetical protein